MSEASAGRNQSVHFEKCGGDATGVLGLLSPLSRSAKLATQLHAYHSQLRHAQHDGERSRQPRQFCKRLKDCISGGRVAIASSCRCNQACVGERGQLTVRHLVPTPPFSSIAFVLIVLCLDFSHFRNMRDGRTEFGKRNRREMLRGRCHQCNNVQGHAV